MAKEAASPEYPPSAQPKFTSQLEEYEQAGKPAFVLTWTEVKLLGIAGVRILSLKTPFYWANGCFSCPGRLFPRWFVRFASEIVLSTDQAP